MGNRFNKKTRPKQASGVSANIESSDDEPPLTPTGENVDDGNKKSEKGERINECNNRFCFLLKKAWYLSICGKNLFVLKALIFVGFLNR